MKNIKLMLLCCLALCFLLCLSCEYGSQEFLYRKHNLFSRITDIKTIDPPSALVTNDSSYVFACVADLHFGSKEAVLFAEKEFFDTLRDFKAPDGKTIGFVINLGDIAEKGTRGEYEQFAAFVQRLKDVRDVPFYSVCGNHDVYNSGWPLWEQYAYPHTSFYRFATDRRSWYFLDTAHGSLGEKQLEYLTDAMDQDSRGRKFVFTHYPLYGTSANFYFVLQNPRERAVLIDLFDSSGVTAYFSGHKHSPSFYSFGSFTEVVVGSLYAKKDRAAAWRVICVDELNCTMKVITYRKSADGPVAKTEKTIAF